MLTHEDDNSNAEGFDPAKAELGPIALEEMVHSGPIAPRDPIVDSEHLGG